MSDSNDVITFRPGLIAEEIEKRGTVKGRVAKRDLSRYYVMLNQASVFLEDEEAVAMTAFVATREWAPMDLYDLANHLSAFLNSPMGRRFNAPRLEYKVSQMSFFERMALVDACEIRWLRAEPTAGATSAA